MKHNQTLRRGLGILISLIMCLSLLPVTALAEVSYPIDINETNFPDEAFRNYILENIDTSKDGKLDENEGTNIKSLSLSDRGITSLKGIEYFPNLTSLYCYRNQIDSLDLSKNTALQKLNCSENKLTSLVLSTALQELDCSNNQLTSLNLSNNTALKTVYCYKNQLTELTLGENTSLEMLNCSSNQLTALSVSSNEALKELSCNRNNLTELIVSSNKYLQDLSCINNQLKELVVSKNDALKELNCTGNQLTALNVSNNKDLTSLVCAENQLKELNLDNNKKLSYFSCSNNELTSLDVSKNTALEELYCYNNKLTYLDASNNTALKKLDCSMNNLTYLDLRNNTKLTDLNAQYNTYEVVPSGNTFDLNNLPGGKFDTSKADEWGGCDFDEETDTLNIYQGHSSVTYDYDCGFGAPVSFELLILENYGITVNGTVVTKSNANNVLTDEYNTGKVSYNADTNTVTINGCLLDESGKKTATVVAGNGTTDIVINGTNNYAAFGLKVTNAKDVTVSSNYNWTVRGAVDITCSGDVKITNGTYQAVDATPFKIKGAKDVTISSANSEKSAPSLASTDCEIDCTGDVLITNDNGTAVSGTLNIKNANDVTVTANNSSWAINVRDANINCRGDVSIVNEKGGGIGYYDPNTSTTVGNLNVTNARNITVSTAVDAVYTDADINCSGTVLFSTTSTDKIAVNGKIKYTHSNGADCTVYAGDSVDNLAELESPDFSKTFEYKVVKIVPKLKDISAASINLGTQNTYNGNEQSVVITSVTFGDIQLTEGTDYEIVSGDTATDVEETTLTIQGIGAYNGTAETTWSLRKSNPAAPTALTGKQWQILFTVKLPDGWRWNEPFTVLESTGEQTFAASYEAVNGNYNDMSDVDITVTVTDAEVYTVTANGFYNTHYGNEPGETFTIKHLVGDSVSLLTGVREGYTLEDLTLSGISEKDIIWAAEGIETDDRSISFTMPDNDVTITINWKKNSSYDSGSGSSYSLEQITSDSKHAVNTDTSGGGKVKIDKNTAAKGSTVTITVTPDEGCELERLIVTDKYGDVIDVVNQGNGEYTFIMPSTKVNIDAYFTTAAEPEAVERTMILTIGDTAADVNGENVENDVAPVIRNERTMLPVRFVAEALGAEVAWDETAQKVTITKGETVIEIYINQPFAFVNNEAIELDSPAFIENGRTYLPLRFIVENLGAEVEWDAVSQKVIIKY